MRHLEENGGTTADQRPDKRNKKMLSAVQGALSIEAAQNATSSKVGSNSDMVLRKIRFARTLIVGFPPLSKLC